MLVKLRGFKQRFLLVNLVIGNLEDEVEVLPIVNAKSIRGIDGCLRAARCCGFSESLEQLGIHPFVPSPSAMVTEGVEEAC